MGKIALLDDLTINQIAAGEVIEHPASALKELIENSQDAGASSITVDTRGGGLSLLAIRDDGEGMDAQDLFLSIQRHATSKVRSAADLFHLKTMGFRGEALAAIASISKMTLHSSIGEGGNLIQVTGGHVEESLKKPRQRGTTIEVRDLFYNVPARLSFQRGAAAETAEIRRVLTRVALSFPHIGLTWNHEGAQQWTLPAAQTLADRILFLLGKDFWSELIEVPGYGFIGVPSSHRPNRQGQYLMINHRTVHSPWLSQKVLETYGTQIPIRRYPIFVLNLDLPPESIDVNVHPQKKEIRFQHESAILIPLQQAMEQALRHSQKKQFGWQPSTMGIPCSPIPHEWKEISDPVLPPRPIAPTALPPSISAPPPSKPPMELEVPPSIRVVGLYSTYLLLHHGEGIQWVHLPRLFYRIRYEKYSKGPVQQALLFPHSIEVPMNEIDSLIQRQKEFEEEGISLRYFGGLTFVVEAIPPWIDTKDLQGCIEDLLHNAGKNIRNILARRGRKAAYSLEEAVAGWSEWVQQGYPNSSPDGDPISVIMCKEKMDGLFR